jgi:hypothetical protein
LFEQLSGLDVSAEALASAAALAAEAEAAETSVLKAGSGATSADVMLLDGEGSEGGASAAAGANAGASAGSGLLLASSALPTHSSALADPTLEEAVSGSLRLGLRRDPHHGCFTFWVSRAFVEETRKRLAAVRKGEEHEGSALLPPALAELLAAAPGADDASVAASEAVQPGGVSGGVGAAAVDINAALRCPHGQLHPDKRLRKRVWAETWRRLLALSSAFAGSTAYPADAGPGAACRECEELETSVREGDRVEIARRSAELTGEWQGLSAGVAFGLLAPRF